MFGLGAPELLIVLAIVLLVFGSTKLPQLARSLSARRRRSSPRVRSTARTSHADAIVTPASAKGSGTIS